jgi:hypothetical protein
MRSGSRLYVCPNIQSTKVGSHKKKRLCRKQRVCVVKVVPIPCPFVVEISIVFYQNESIVMYSNDCNLCMEDVKTLLVRKEKRAYLQLCGALNLTIIQHSRLSAFADCDVSIAATTPAFYSHNLIVQRTQVHACLGPCVEVILHGDGAA